MEERVHPEGDGHVILLGVGTVGREVMRRLHEAGARVLAIDRQPSGEARIYADGLGIAVMELDILRPGAINQVDIRGARAFIACTSDDRVNLSAALAVNDLRPTLRTVVRLNNEQLGEQLEARFPEWTVLSLPGLSSPAFVAAALAAGTLRAWRVADDVVAVLEIPVEEPSLVRSWVDVAPLYIRRESGVVEHWPPPQTPMRSGDRMGAVASARTLTTLGSTEFEYGAGAAGPTILARTVRAISTFFADVDPRLAIVIGLAIGLATLATIVYMEAKGLDFVASLYFVITTMVTVGYGDINLAEDPAEIKLFGSALMIVSLLIFSVITAFVTNWVLSTRLSRLFGTTRTAAIDHAIVCGLGNVGARVLADLRRTMPGATAIDPAGTGAAVSEALRSGATVVTGDARQQSAFQRANAIEARSVVVATGDDMLNLEIALNAREASPRSRIVLRLFDEEFASRVRSTFDIDSVLSPAAIAAPAFTDAAMGRSAVDHFTVDGRSYVYARLRIELGSMYVGATISDLLAHGLVAPFALVPSVGEARFRPAPRTALRAGDTLHVICAPETFGRLTADDASATVSAS